MASFAPIRGTRAQISSTPRVDGQFLVETDQGDQNKTYIDVDINGTIERTMCGGGGHEMIPVSNTAGHTEDDVNTIAAMTYTDSQDDKVANAYTVKRYSNVDCSTLYTLIAKGTNTIGLWEDDPDWKQYDPTVDDPTVYRAGWLWHKDFYNILANNSTEIEFVFDVANSEVVNIYAYRVDDNVPMTIDGSVVNGGAIAIKLNGAISSDSGVNIGINLKRQRTQVGTLTTISS